MTSGAAQPEQLHIVPGHPPTVDRGLALLSRKHAPQPPHTRHQIYCDLLFIPAGVEHRFEELSGGEAAT